MVQAKWRHYKKDPLQETLGWRATLFLKTLERSYLKLQVG